MRPIVPLSIGMERGPGGEVPINMAARCHSHFLRNVVRCSHTLEHIFASSLTAPERPYCELRKTPSILRNELPSRKRKHPNYKTNAMPHPGAQPAMKWS